MGVPSRKERQTVDCGLYIMQDQGGETQKQVFCIQLLMKK